ncbi:hypothetical protein TGFOU_364770, partial [Toxoplasma gondii FOU]
GGVADRTRRPLVSRFLMIHGVLFSLLGAPELRSSLFSCFRCSVLRIIPETFSPLFQVFLSAPSCSRSKSYSSNFCCCRRLRGSINDTLSTFFCKVHVYIFSCMCMHVCKHSSFSFSRWAISVDVPC